jgi:phosphate transport system protein
MYSNRQRFDDELGELRVRLLEMGTATEELVRDSVIALTTQDMALAATIIPRDDAVDRMDVEIEAMCLRLMARQQPLAADLRLIGTALKVITDIERIGDHAVDISRVAQRMEREMVYKPLVDIPRLGELARVMLHDALEAFIHRDLGMVEKVLAQDDAVDALYARMRQELQEIMQRDADSVLQASYLLFVVHYIERMCDHCCNIVERVGFMETGRLRGRITAVALDSPAIAENRPPMSLTAHAEAA